jgi:HAD superfamily hydrolase (TIGR01509 family)
MGDPQLIRNIIFDLGGVLYAIEPARTVAGLKALAGPRARDMAMDDPLFLALEMGTITPATFRHELRIALDSQATDAQLDAAWNALLLGLIAGRTEAVRAFSQRYRVALLSNTNSIHQVIWGPQCAEMFGSMERIFFSYDMGMRKPDAVIYEHVLATMGMDPAETLFVDDGAINIVGAQAVGLHTLHIDPTSPDQFSHFCLEFLGKV